MPVASRVANAQTVAMHGGTIDTGGGSAAATLLGIDPGLQRTGYAVARADRRGVAHVLEAGVVRLTAGRSLERRLLELDEALRAVIEQHRPVVLACEQLYSHYAHPRTAILMGHARGVVLALAARSGMSVIHIASTHVKKHLTGSGHANKRQMQAAVAMLLGLAKPPEPHDVADAIAVALCGLRMRAAGQALTARRGRVAAGGPA
jgi:crossover junction endodeoxyribonuclease RuvC